MVKIYGRRLIFYSIRAFVFFEHNFHHRGQDGGGDEGLKKAGLSRNEMLGNESEEKNALLQFQVFCSTTLRIPNPLLGAILSVLHLELYSTDVLRPLIEFRAGRNSQLLWI